MLINCVAYQGGEKLNDISIEAISEHVAQPGCFVWVALFDPTPEELAVMQVEFGLHELAVEDALEGHERPKIVEYGDSLFAVLHMIDAVGGELQIGEVDIFVGPNYVLSVRKRSRHGFQMVRTRCQEEPHLLRQGPAFVLYALMDAVVDRYFPVLGGLESEIERIEEQIFARKSQRDAIEGLYELKFKVTQFRHAVLPLLEDVGKLHGGRVPALCRDMDAYFRDIYEHLMRIDSTIDDLRDDIATAIQLNLSLATVDASDVNKRLAAWAGIFAVATAFAGIWGMNFEHMPELKWEWGYPAALLLILCACSLLYWRFKRAKWL